MNFEGTRDAVIRMIAGENIDVNVDRFMNTMDSFASRDDVFAYLIHLGYLAYNLDEGTCRIPNREVRDEWLNAIADDKDYSVREMTAGKGFADLVYIPVHPGNPERPAMIMELKRNDLTESALEQIKNKQYFDALAHYQGRLLFVGIDYDEKEKTHTCRMEWFEKES